MTAALLPGIPGLLLGLTLCWTGLSRPEGLRASLALRCCHPLRSLLYALGVPMVLTALLCWLAVIDVDGIAVLPLTAGALTGGALFGIAAGLTGFTPLTACAGLAGPRLPEALCTLAGCAAAALAWPWLEPWLTALRSLPPQSATTLFEVTLDEPFLLGGGFLGQACAGLLLMSAAVCIPSNLRLRQTAVPAEEIPTPEETPDAAEGTDGAAEECSPTPEGSDAPSAETGSTSEESTDTPEDAADAASEPPPSTAPEDTFIALLPGEEPLVVDTAMDAANPGEDEPHPPEPL